MILALADIHLKESIGYSDLIPDGRLAERKEILDFIVKQADDCETIIIAGDSFDKRNNPSEIVRLFVEFIERYGKKRVIITKGNHEQMNNGKSAIDFLKEIKNKLNWTIATDKIFTTTIESRKMVFCPYFSNAELGVSSNKEGTKKLLKMLPDGDVLFIHHAISDIKLSSGQSTNLFDEVVLPKKILLEKYKLVVGSHIHVPYQKDNLVVLGSIFNNEVNETGKFIWKINNKLEVEKIALPGRKIYGLENTTIEDLDKIKKSSIVKVTLTDLKYKNNIEELREKLKEFDAHVLIEQYPHERKKLHFDEGMLEFDVEKLLSQYASTRKINLNVLQRAWQLIK